MLAPEARHFSLCTNARGSFGSSGIPDRHKLFIKLRPGSDVIINAILSLPTDPALKDNVVRSSCNLPHDYVMLNQVKGNIKNLLIMYSNIKLVWPNLPVHTPVAFSSSPLIHVLPEP